LLFAALVGFAPVAAGAINALNCGGADDRIEGGSVLSVAAGPDPASGQITFDGIRRSDGAFVASFTASVIVGTVLEYSDGVVIPDLNGFAAGDGLKQVRYCPQNGSPPPAVSVTKQAASPVGQPSILSLDVPPGTESQPVARIYGDDPGDNLAGDATDGVAFGDINGDGFDDVVAGTRFNGGEVYVVYGSADLPATPVDLNTDGMISAAGETRIIPGTSQELLGTAVATGDVDADGFDDVLIGAPAGGPLSGETIVVYGSAALPGTIVDLALAGDQTTILADELQESAGSSLASGDVNADGYTDIIIGAPGRTPFAAHHGGRVYVVYGNATMRGATLDMDTDETISSAGETRIFGESWEDFAGSSVASGDINGDGFDDVILGADRANILFTADRGGVYVVYGSAALAGTIVDLSATPNAIGPAGETRVFGRSSNSWLGTSVASGDVNNDGFDDLLLSATGVTGVGDNFAVGEVYLFYGGADLPGTILDLRNLPGTYGETWITGTEEFGELGSSLASADVNGDGFDDLVLGAPGSVFPGAPDSTFSSDGLLFVFDGSAALAGQRLIDPREVANLLVVPDNPDDRFGHSVEAGGDLDRNGIAEYGASAASGDNPSIGGNNFTGYVAAIFGAATTPGATRIEHSISGDAPATDFGPVVRCRLNFSGGSATSTDAVSLTRSAPPAPPSGTALPVHWQISTDRSDFAVDVTLVYTDAELGFADEARLAVYASPSGIAGSWTPAGSSQTQSELRNEITVRDATLPSFFAIVETSGGPPSPTPTATASPTATMMPPVTCPAAPQLGCHAPTVGQKALVILKDGSVDARDRLVWKWSKGGVTSKADFGTPLSTTSYHLCVYDGTGLVLSALAPAGGTCGARPCWKEGAHTFKYLDREQTPDGLRTILLREGSVPGRAKITVTAKGPLLGIAALDGLASPLRVQLGNSAGACWDAAYSFPPALRHTASQFRDRAD